MNCIASLLYDICGGEEEAFYIFNCLLTSTDYGDLYFNDFKGLNKYFYIFERYIFIYLPEVYLHLTSTKISINFSFLLGLLIYLLMLIKALKEKENKKF